MDNQKQHQEKGEVKKNGGEKSPKCTKLLGLGNYHLPKRAVLVSVRNYYVKQHNIVLGLLKFFFFFQKGNFSNITSTTFW
jgi:hypothetical protein